jgi:hypothetical protein
MPSIQVSTQGSWSRFCWIDQSQEVMQIVAALERIFTSDPDIHAVTRHAHYPF